MALAGVHIAFGYGSVGVSSFGKALASALPSGTTASQTMAASAVSTVAAPDQKGQNYQPLLSIMASAAIYYITGPNVTLAQVTDGGTPRRYFDPSFGPQDVFVNPGDRFAWALA